MYIYIYIFIYLCIYFDKRKKETFFFNKIQAILGQGNERKKNTSCSFSFY